MNLSDLKRCMAASAMNRRIIIQQLGTPSIITTDNGFDIENWVSYTTVWAAPVNLSGREYFAAMAVQAEKTTEFVVRYKAGITTDMRISFNSKYFNIISIDDVDYGHAFMVLRATEVK